MKHRLTIHRPKPVFALLLALSLISAFFLLSPAPATAEPAPSQCNDVYNTGGQAVECHYKITNNLNGSQTSSTIESQVCIGAANAAICGPWTTTSSTDLVTSVSQCNNSGLGGLATIFCTVEVVNNITGTTTTTAATVNQCNESGAGGGADPLLCDPYPATTTNATVTQCNGVANGGGGTERVQCTVGSASTTTTMLTVRVNQCNVPNTTMPGTYVTCSTSITNNVTAAQEPEPTPTPTPSPTPEPTPAESPTPSPTASPSPSPSPTEPPVATSDATPEALPAIPTEIPDATIPVAAPADDAFSGDAVAGPAASGGGGTPSGGGGTPSVGGGTPSGGLTGGQISRVPVGAAAAGGGSTAGVENLWMLLTGLVLLMAAGSAGVVRQRVHADS